MSNFFCFRHIMKHCINELKRLKTLFTLFLKCEYVGFVPKLIIVAWNRQNNATINFLWHFCSYCTLRIDMCKKENLKKYVTVKSSSGILILKFVYRVLQFSLVEVPSRPSHIKAKPLFLVKETTPIFSPPWD